MHQNSLESISIQSEVVYSQLVHGLPIAIYGCNAEGKITFFNQAAVDLWGREPIIGKDQWCGSWKIFKPDGTHLPLESCPMALTLKEERAVKGEEILVERPDGTRCNVLPYPQPVFNANGVLIGAINSLVDITKQKNDQKALIELERSNNELASFSSTASHDLQEPLRRIIIFSDKLKEGSKESLSPESKECLEKIITSSNRMRKLIEDVLNFSHISNSDKKFEKVDLNEILKNTLTDFDQRILEKKAILVINELPVIYAIPLQMTQLFHNLLSNALKFSSINNLPQITISAKQLSAEEIKNQDSLNPSLSYFEITFTDNGIGFSQEYAEQIFTIFQRLHSQNQYSGTGIGLALCRRIADNHNGVIFASSKENIGTQFHIILPFMPQK